VTQFFPSLKPPSSSMARTFQGHEPLGSASDFSDSFARYGFGPGSPVTDEFATITLNPVHTRDESTDATHALLGPNVPSDSPSRRPINKNPQPKSRFSDPSARASRGNSLPSPARSNSKGVAFAFRPQNALQGFRDLGRRLFNWGHRRPFFVFLIISSCLASTAMTAYSTYNWAWGKSILSLRIMYSYESPCRSTVRRCLFVYPS